MGGGLADRSIISRLSVKARKAGAQMLVITTHSPERRKEKAKGGWDRFMLLYPFLVR
jgi:hypothetical protein